MRIEVTLLNSFCFPSEKGTTFVLLEERICFLTNGKNTGMHFSANCCEITYSECLEKNLESTSSEHLDKNLGILLLL